MLSPLGEFPHISISDKDRYSRLDSYVRARRKFGLAIPISTPKLNLYDAAIDRVIRTGQPSSRLRDFLDYMKTRDIYIFWSVAVNTNNFSGSKSRIDDQLLLIFDPNQIAATTRPTA